jgi:hypothetical protein
LLFTGIVRSFLGKIVFYDCDNYKKPLSPNQVIYLKRRFFYA